LKLRIVPLLAFFLLFTDTHSVVRWMDKHRRRRRRVSENASKITQITSHFTDFISRQSWVLLSRDVGRSTISLTFKACFHNFPFVSWKVSGDQKTTVVNICFPIFKISCPNFIILLTYFVPILSNFNYVKVTFPMNRSACPEYKSRGFKTSLLFPREFAVMDREPLCAKPFRSSTSGRFRSTRSVRRTPQVVLWLAHTTEMFSV